MSIREQVVDNAATSDQLGFYSIAYKDSDHFVVAFLNDEGGGAYSSNAHYTADGGITWSENQISATNNGGYPIYAIYDPTTARYIVALTEADTDIKVYYSTNGTSWTLSDPSFTGYYVTGIANGDGTTYIALKKVSDSGFYILGTDDGGDTFWDDTVYTSFATYNPRAAADNNGNSVYLFKADSVLKTIYSDDYGATFSAGSTVVSDNAAGWWVAMHPSNGVAIILYETSANQVKCKVSLDAGQSWGSEVLVEDSNIYTAGVSFSGSQIKVGFMRWDSGNSHWDLYYTSSNDNGATWSTAVKQEDQVSSSLAVYRNMMITRYNDGYWWLIQVESTLDCGIDAVITSGAPVYFDAVTIQTKTKTTSLDAVIIERSSETFADAVLQQAGVTSTTGLDAGIAETNLATLTLDFLASKVRYKTPSIDASLSGTHYNYVQMDAMFENVEMSGSSEVKLDASGSGHVTRYLSGAADFELGADGVMWRTSLLVGSANIELTAEGYEGVRGDADFEMQASGSMEFGKVMSGSANLKLQATATALSTILATGSAQVALDAPGGTLVNTTVSAAGGTARLGLDSSGSMTIGYVITGDADLALDTATTNIILPGWVMVGTVEVALRTEGHVSAYDVQGTFEVLVLNPETAALSTYTNFGFNSFCKYADAYLGAKGTDIVSLTGSNDDTTDISAYITTPTFDISQGSMRSLIDMWLVGRSSGKLISTFEWDEKYIAKDVIRHLRNTVDEARITLPRGMRGRMFNIKIENVDGSDFDLSSIRILGVPLGPKRSR